MKTREERAGRHGFVYLLGNIVGATARNAVTARDENQLGSLVIEGTTRRVWR